MAYKIIEAQNTHYLQDRVNEAIAEWYLPTGWICATRTSWEMQDTKRFYQAMIK